MVDKSYCNNIKSGILQIPDIFYHFWKRLLIGAINQKAIYAQQAKKLFWMQQTKLHRRRCIENGCCTHLIIHGWFCNRLMPSLDFSHINRRQALPFFVWFQKIPLLIWWNETTIIGFRMKFWFRQELSILCSTILATNGDKSRLETETE